MKRFGIAASVLCLTTALALAQSTSEVTSVNAVGYLRVSVPSNALALVTLDFEYLGDGNFTVTNLIGDQLGTSGDTVFIWDRVAKKYNIESRGRFGWSPGTNVIRRGDGIWLKNTAVTAKEVVFTGEVPDSNTAPTTTLQNLTAIDAVGYAYPADVAFTNTTLCKNSKNGDTLFLWDVVTQNYVIYSNGRFGWNPSVDAVTVKMGEAFWFKTATPTNWTEAIPYNLN